MDELNAVSKRLAELIPASSDSMPAIELYMDQVLEYIGQNPVSFSAEDKLTSAMINNYIKDGLIPRANGKKYNKKHFASLMIVARLKQVLSVKYIGKLLRVREAESGEGDYYEAFRATMQSVCADAAVALSKDTAALSAAALHFAVDSYVKKVISEYIIDMLMQDEGPKKEEKQKTKGN
jgi:hypothetical protein